MRNRNYGKLCDLLSTGCTHCKSPTTSLENVGGKQRESVCIFPLLSRNDKKKVISDGKRHFNSQPSVNSKNPPTVCNEGKILKTLLSSKVKPKSSADILLLLHLHCPQVHRALRHPPDLKLCIIKQPTNSGIYWIFNYLNWPNVQSKFQYIN